MGFIPDDEEEPFQQDTFEQEADTSGRGFLPDDQQQGQGFVPDGQQGGGGFVPDTAQGDGAAGQPEADVSAQPSNGQQSGPGPVQPTEANTGQTQTQNQPLVSGVVDAFTLGGDEEVSIGGVELMSENVNPIEQARNSLRKGIFQGIAGGLKAVANVQARADRAEDVTESLNLSGIEGGDQMQDKMFYQAGQEIAGSVQEAFPDNPERQGDFLTQKLPHGVGSGLSYIAVGTAGWPAGATMGGLSVAQNRFERAKREGASDEEAFQQFLYNIPAGAAEAFPAVKFLRRMDRFTGGGMKKVLKGGGSKLLNSKPVQSAIGGLEEAVQETVSQAYANWQAGRIYDKSRRLLEGVTENGTVGFGSGLLLNAMGLSLRGRYAQAETKEERADIVEAYKYATQRGANERAKSTVLDMEDLQAAELENALNERAEELNSIGRQEAQEPGEVMTLPNHEKDLAQWSLETKPVDEAGNPIPFYHATDRAYQEVSDEYIGTEHDEGWYGRGLYWNADPGEGKGYFSPQVAVEEVQQEANRDEFTTSQEDVPQPNQRKAYLDLRNPLIVERARNEPGSKQLNESLNEAINDPEVQEDFNEARMLLETMQERTLDEINMESKSPNELENTDALNKVERKRWNELTEKYGDALFTDSSFRNIQDAHMGGAMATGFAQAAGKDGVAVFFAYNRKQGLENANEVVVFNDEQVRNAWDAGSGMNKEAPIGSEEYIGTAQDPAPVPDKYSSTLLNAYEQYAFAKENREATSGVMDAPESVYNEQAALHEQKLREVKQRARAQGVNPISFIRDMENRGYGTQAVAQMVAEEMAVQARQQAKSRRVQEAHEVSPQQKTLMLTKPEGPTDVQRLETTAIESKARETYVPQKERRMRDKLKAWFLGGSITKATEPQAVRQEHQIMEGAIGTQVKQLQLITGKYLRALNQEGNKVDESRQQQEEQRLMEDTQAVLTGEKEIETLPKSMREPVMEMRIHVDRLSQQAIKDGIVSGELEAAVKQNLGIYLKRNYRIDDVEDWGRSNLDQEVLNEAAAYLQKENPEWSNERIQNEIDLILKQDREADYGRSPRKGQVNFSSLKRRKTDDELDPRIRALMGEYTQGHVNYMKSVMNLAQMIHKSRFNQRIKEIGLEAGFIRDRASDERVPEHFVPVTLSNKQLDTPEQKRQNSTLVADPDVAQALNEVDDQFNPGPFIKAILTMNAGAKYSKTVLNQITHGRNLAGVVGFGLQNARAPKGKDFRWAYNVSVANARNKLDSNLLAGDPDRTQLEKDLLQMTKFGLLDQDVAIGEIKGLVDDVTDSDSMESVVDKMIPGKANDNPVYKAARFLRLSAENASKVYQAEDNMIRLAFYKAEQRRYRKALPNWSDDRINAHVARIVKQTYQDYSQLPNWVQEIRRVPAFGTFVSFHAEVARTSANTAQLGWQELNSSNQELKKIGAKRLAGLTASLTPIVGADAGLAAAAGYLLSSITPDEDDWLRDFLAPWDKDSELAHVGRDGLDFFYVNVSHLDPMSVVKEPIARAVRNGEEPTLDRLLGAARKLAGPFLDKEIIANKLWEAKNGQTAEGANVWNKADSKGEKLKKSIWHVYEGFEPGAFKSARRLGYSYDVSANQAIPDPLQVGDELPESRNKRWQEALGAMGLRVTKVNLARSMEFQGDEYAKQIQAARSDFNREAKYNENATPEEVSSAIQEANQSYRQSFKEMSRKVENARKLGMTWNEIDRKLEEADVAKKYREDLKRGWPRQLVGFEDLAQE